MDTDQFIVGKDRHGDPAWHQRDSPQRKSGKQRRVEVSDTAKARSAKKTIGIIWASIEL